MRGAATLCHHRHPPSEPALTIVSKPNLTRAPRQAPRSQTAHPQLTQRQPTQPENHACTPPLRTNLRPAPTLRPTTHPDLNPPSLLRAPANPNIRAASPTPGSSRYRGTKTTTPVTLSPNSPRECRTARRPQIPANRPVDPQNNSPQRALPRPPHPPHHTPPPEPAHTRAMN